eukprot:5436996-Pleurochrysis_carterae.AAC.1
MATFWSVRTGLELLDEKLAQWSESWVVKKDDSLSLNVNNDRTVHMSRGQDASTFDLGFTSK